MSTSAQIFEHLKKRYSFRMVCRILGISARTLHRWLKEGIPLPGGRRISIECVQLGPRKKEFECDEVERVYQLLKAASDGEVIPFPDSDQRDELRNRSMGSRDEKEQHRMSASSAFAKVRRAS